MLWEDNYIAHFGIKGQKWGVRRYQNPDGTLTEAGKAHYSVNTGGNERLANKFIKENAKLQKLSDKADINKQQDLYQKYKKRSSRDAKIGTAAAAASAGTLLGFSKLNKDIQDKINWNNQTIDKFKKAGQAQVDALDDLGPFAALIPKADLDMLLNNTGHSADIIKTYKTKNQDLYSTRSTLGTYMPLLSGVAAATAAGAYGAAGYNKAKAAIARKRTTEKGHAKAVAKREAQFSKMMNTFAGTPYADLLKRQNGR